jgi:vacuolar-type H+-ATPase subunit I/STV1
MPSDAVLPGSAPEGLIEKLTGVAKSFFVILFWESAQLAVLDRVLLALIVIGVLVSLLYFKEISSQLYISVLFSVLVIGAINGTVGVNFRYQLPVIGFLAWVLIASLPKAGYRLFR